jgi:hypothetical protein
VSSSPSTAKKTPKTTAKRARGMAQAADHLPSKSKTLTSNPSTAKQQQRKVRIRANQYGRHSDQKFYKIDERHQLRLKL